MCVCVCVCERERERERERISSSLASSQNVCVCVCVCEAIVPLLAPRRVRVGAGSFFLIWGEGWGGLRLEAWLRWFAHLFVVLSAEGAQYPTFVLTLSFCSWLFRNDC